MLKNALFLRYYFFIHIFMVDEKMGKRERIFETKNISFVLL